MGTRISDLTEAAAFTGTELVPVVQSGNTVKATSAQFRTTNASELISGTVSPARLPAATTTSQGAVLFGSSAGTAAQGNDSRLNDSRTPTGSAGGDLTGTYPSPTLAASGVTAGIYGGTNVIPSLQIDNKGRIIYATTAQVTALGTAGGDLTGSYPNPTLDVTGVVSGTYGTGDTIPRLTIDAKGRIMSVTGVPVSSTAGGTVTSITAGTGLSGGTITNSGTIAVSYGSTAGTATEGNDSRLSDSRTPSGSAGGDLTGTYPNPTLASVTTAQVAVGSSTQIPVITVNAKGQITNLTTALSASGVALTTSAPANLASSAAVGIGNTAARSDHQHAFPTASEVGALGATASAGGDLTGSYPNPTLASITTAQTAVGSSTVIPVLTIDAKGRITGLTTASNPQGTVTSVTGGTGLSGGTITGSGTLAVSYGSTAGTAAQGNDSRLSDSRTPTGTAGGDLAGTYPNPTINTVPVAKGGTGLTATPANGQIPIGNATGYTLATLTAGSNVSITNAAGAITINSSAGASTGAASAFVNFNGVSTPSIRSSFNVSSITKNGTGDYTVNFTTALNNANYAVVCAPDSTSGNAFTLRTIDATTARTVNLVRIQTLNLSGTPVDSSIVQIAVFVN